MHKALLTVLTLFGFVSAAPAFAQQPPPPPPGDVAPPPLPAEGEKTIQPPHGHEKHVAPPSKKVPRKRPPVKPPTPEAPGDGSEGAIK